MLKKLVQARPHSFAFFEGGDSASFIIDILGRGCGLLYSEYTGYCCPRMDVGAGLIINMSDIQRSMALKVKLRDHEKRTFRRACLTRSD